ncbi:MAG: hypothetical protein WBZ36_25130 [Candidatus Nitrosopolaris sp.]
MKGMQKWIEDYEKTRHSKQPKESNPGWVSSKYPIESMHWQELQQLYLPTLGLNWGQACSSLKKLWKSYKIAGRNGEPRGDLAWKIRNIQSAMGIERSNFPELEGMDDEDQELKMEEEEESGGEWELNSGTSEKSELYTEEWSEEDKRLLKEEREAEKENDDWW